MIKHGEWISVDEALPPVDKDDCTPDYSTSTYVLCSDGKTVDKGFVSYGGGAPRWCTENEEIGKIIHWMPLPEPQKDRMTGAWEPVYNVAFMKGYGNE